MSNILRTVISAVAVFAALPLRAADAPPSSAAPPASVSETESLRKEIEALKAEVERLKQRPAAGGASADDLKDAEERIDALEKKTKELELRQTQTTSANPLTVLNPTLTVVGNFLWRMDDHHVYNENGDRIDDQANLREAELDLRAAIDPYADGVFIASVSSDVPGSYSVDVEEFLINVKSLPVPFWEEPPLGTKIKIGRMRTEFGRNNRLHLHDLPQSDRPLVIDTFLGPDGYAANGLSTTSFLPSPGETALELTLQALQGGGVPIAQDDHHPAYLGNLRWFVPLGDEHSFDASAIGFYGTNDPEGHAQSRVLSVDVLYRWKPMRQGEYQSFVLGGQLFTARHEFRADLGGGAIGPVRETSPFGYTVWGQYQLSSRLYAGVRWDEAELLTDDRARQKRVTPYLSCYLSEFLRARVSYEHLWSDVAADDGRNTFLFELNAIFGSHPTEPFWVNK